MQPYPLATQPFFQDYIWGGRKLASQLGKKLPAQGVWAESWEIVDHDEHQSLVANGPLAGKSLREIAAKHPDWLFGPRSPELKSLPLLLKYLDCQRVLSVQVHPDDRYAQQMSPPDLGKTEAWLIIAAEPDSVLYAGLKEGVRRSDLEAAIEAGTTQECLHEIRPSAGDCVFIPAGTVHALGAGLLVAEIQQASNTTFRIFDWNRLGNDGKPRPLHVQQALEVIDFSAGPRSLQLAQTTDQVGHSRLVSCDKFVLDRLRAGEHGDSLKLAATGAFRLLTAPAGGVSLRWHDSDNNLQNHALEIGQSVVLPAAMPNISATIAPDAYLLDMRQPD